MSCGSVGGSLAFVLAHILGFICNSLGETRDRKERVFESLEVMVLLLGVAAGLAVGIFVGIDALDHLDTKTPDYLHQLITRAIGPGAVSGLILAVLVAVGSIVLIFERRISSFLEKAAVLTDAAEKTRVKIEELKPEVVDSLGSLHHLAHVLLGVRQRLEDTKPQAVSAEAVYLNSWMNLLNETANDNETAVVRAIAESYWHEEAFDVSRFKLVTNSRNYTAFLIAAVDALRTSHPGREIHFYTVTPAGPLSIINWPEEDRVNDADPIHIHRGAHFVNTYMLFVRELVQQAKATNDVVHRRWIWTNPEPTGNGNRFKKPPSFESWACYENFKMPYGKRADMSILGVPLTLEDVETIWGIAKTEVLTEAEHTLWCGTHKGMPTTDMQAEWKKWKDDHGAYVAIQPFVEGADGTTEFCDNLRRWRTRLDQILLKDWKSLEALIVATERIEARKGARMSLLAQDTETAQGVRRYLEGGETGPGKRQLPTSGRLLMLMQHLNSFFGVAGHLIENDRSEITVSCEGMTVNLTVLEQRLVQRKWCELWENESHVKLPSFERYFRDSFQTDHHPYFQDMDVLKDPNNRALFDKTGPEFAILGLKDPYGKGKHTLTLANGSKVEVLLASRSTIASPWRWGEIEVILADKDNQERPDNLRVFVDALQALIGSSRI